MDRQMQQMGQPLRGRMFRQDNARPRQQQILVLKTGIAGIQFNIESKDEMDALDTIVPGTELLLYREPDNEHDAWAVSIYLTETDKLGYITRFKNETIARLMDAGKKFVCIVDDPSEDEEARAIVEKDQRRNRNAATENMAFPVSIYLVEEG